MKTGPGVTISDSSWQELRRLGPGLVQFIRDAIRSRSLEGSITVPAEFCSLAPGLRVDIILRVAGRLRGVGSTRENSLVEEALRSAYKATQDERFGGPLTEQELATLTVEMWVQTLSEPIKASEINRIRLGIDGAEVALLNRTGYLRPDEAIVRQCRSIEAFLRAVCREAHLADHAWSSPHTELRRTSWLHFAEGPMYSAMELRLLRPREHPSGLVMEYQHVMASGADHLAANQCLNGNYLQQYNVLSGRGSNKPFNPSHAVEGIFAMAKVCQAMSAHPRVEIWLASLARAVSLYTARAVQLASGGAFIEEGPKDEEPFGKLDTTALLAVTVSLPLLREAFSDVRMDLVRAMGSIQGPDGAFLEGFGTGLEKRASADAAGKAMLGLVLDGSPESQEKFDRACRYYLADEEGRLSLWQALALSATPGTTKQWANRLFSIADSAASHSAELVSTPSAVPYLEGPPTEVLLAAGEIAALAASAAYRKSAASEYARYADLSRQAWERAQACFVDASAAAVAVDPARAIGGAVSTAGGFDLSLYATSRLMTFAATAASALG